MVWYRLGTSHYLGQSWPRSLQTYHVTRPQWVEDGLWSKYNGPRFRHIDSHYKGRRIRKYNQELCSDIATCFWWNRRLHLITSQHMSPKYIANYSLFLFMYILWIIHDSLQMYRSACHKSVTRWCIGSIDSMKLMFHARLWLQTCPQSWCCIKEALFLSGVSLVQIGINVRLNGSL